MAFAFVGSIGNAQDKSGNLASLVLTTTAAAEVNNLVILAVASDNDGTQNGNEHTA